MRDKIPCGGFYLDDTLKVDENNTLGLAPGAGKEPFKVTFTMQDGSIITSDKTLAEIQEAYKAGKYVYGEIITGFSSVFCPLGGITNTVAQFLVIIEKNYYILAIGSKDATNATLEPLGSILSPSKSSDDNKFVQVINGRYQLSDTIIIPSSTSGSTKKFKITVDDSGNLSTTQVT